MKRIEMIKKMITIMCIAHFLIAISATDIYALGIGGYLSGKGGISTLKVEETNSSVDYGVGAGFVLDTAVATNDSMNYRLAVGYDNMVKSGVPFFTDWSMHRVSISNVIGFAFFKNTFLRVWMGPQIELSYQLLKVNNTKMGFNVDGESSSFYKIRYHFINYSSFSLGLGGILGININTAGPFTISFEIGINTSIGIGPYQERIRKYTYFTIPGFIEMWMPSRNSSRSTDTIIGKAEAIARLSFIYRFSEQYNRETPQKVDLKLKKM